jgi:ubiquinone/menaquinone biosynthesis C-methylase UbiE
MGLREDYRKIAKIYGDDRAAERIVAHYELERQIADEMRNSTQQEREGGLYTRLYERLLGGLPDHPRKKPDTEAARESRRKYVERQAALIRAETDEHDVVLDVGGGDCAVTLLVAPHVRRAIVLDVSDQLVPADVNAPNFQFVKTAGVNVALPSETVTFIYSNQVMEHLHPEDALAQLRELHRVLRPGGRYLCRTPNRITGPHDVSSFFDDVARGMHMKEYTYGELDRIFREAGFARTRILVAPRAYRLFALPCFVAIALEWVFAQVPRRFHTRICRSRVGRSLLGITMIAEKA